MLLEHVQLRTEIEYIHLKMFFAVFIHFHLGMFIGLWNDPLHSDASHRDLFSPYKLKMVKSRKLLMGCKEENLDIKTINIKIQ